MKDLEYAMNEADEELLKMKKVLSIYIYIILIIMKDLEYAMNEADEELLIMKKVTRYIYIYINIYIYSYYYEGP